MTCPDRCRTGLQRFKALPVLLPLLWPVSAFGGDLTPFLVTDLNPGSQEVIPLAQPEMASAGDVLYFTARDGSTGIELWRTEGTPESTRPVRDICPGPCDSNPNGLTVLGSSVYFFADDGATGRELWVSDGTAPGTRLLRDLCPGPCGSVVDPSLFAVSGGRLFFESNGHLWTSDGTPGGTQTVTDGSPCYGVSDLTATDTGVAFRSQCGGQAIWVSDGTAAGTHSLDAVCPFGCENYPPWFPHLLFPFDGAIFYWNSALTTPDLCRTLYRAALGGQIGKVMTFCGATEYEPPTMVKLGKAAFFGFGHRLWRLDPGSVAATPLRDFADTPDELAVLNGRLFFVAATPETGRELWQTDGTPAGTVLTVDLIPGPGSDYPQGMTVAGNHLFFSVAFDDTLWQSDGTAAGTGPIVDPALHGGFASVTPAGPLTYFLRTQAGGLGSELWRTDGTSQGIVRVYGASTAPDSSNPRNLHALGDLALFTASTDATSPARYRLWRSDGTAAGTELLRDDISSISGLVPFGDRHLFLAGNRLWETDGTSAGTRQLSDFTVYEVAVLGDRLILVAFPKSGESYSLWVATGGAGPLSLQALAPPEAKYPHNLRPAGTSLFFSTYGPHGEKQLWKTDGTASGTAMALCPSCNNSSIVATLGPLVLLSDVWGVWRSDGTSDGTYLLSWPDQPHSSRLLGWTTFQRRLFFFSDDSNGTESLWSTDASRAGIVKVAAVTAPGQPRPDHKPKVVGDRLFFTTWNEAAGEELWVSDGTAAGTHMLIDLLPGPPSASPRELTAVGRFLFFTADDGTTGRELWMTDGTAAGTKRVSDIAPGAAPSVPLGVTVAGHHAFFSADDTTSGRELWAVDVSTLQGCTPGPDHLCLLGGRFTVTAHFKDQHNGGREGQGTAIPDSDQSGFFWFFAPGNLELAVKMLDGGAQNGHFWVLFGALSDIEYDVTVTDGMTGEVRTYHNPPGTFCGQADTGAFSEPVRAFAASPAGSCTPGPGALCLGGGRFRVAAHWRNPQDGSEGAATAVPRTDESGTFWFFSPGNIELLVKVLDGRPVNGKIWVFYGALSNVEYWLDVTDTATGALKTYHNPAGSYCGKGDTGAF